LRDPIAVFKGDYYYSDSANSLMASGICGFMAQTAPATFALQSIIVWLVCTRIFAGRDQRA
jgi:hypothetical protein